MVVITVNNILVVVVVAVNLAGSVIDTAVAEWAASTMEDIQILAVPHVVAAVAVIPTGGQMTRYFYTHSMIRHALSSCA